MNPFFGKTHLFCACLKFGDRFFDVNLYDDGSSNWYDNLGENEVLKVDPHFDQRTEFAPRPQDLALQALLVREYTVVAQLPAYEFNFILKKLMPGYRRRKVYRSTEELCIRAILVEFFWKEINPQFSPPIPEGTAEDYHLLGRNLKK
ncbi:MAG: hypothetical protein H0X66_13285 [Verrucomicrobia bacterium]|nr:hypothetical protein [Verrucomicrobiota bacterium]